MKNLTNPAWIKAKGILFLFLGLLSAVLLFFERPTLRVAALLLLAVWSFCRFYYFTFYVLERYVDPTYKFSGLFSLGRYLLRRPPQKALTSPAIPTIASAPAPASSPSSGNLSRWDSTPVIREFCGLVAQTSVCPLEVVVAGLQTRALFA